MNEMNVPTAPINPDIPQHVAVIMDGNRRWARERHLPEIAGHKKVADGVLETLVEHAANCGVKYMTFWAWSTENWGRKATEVSGVMDIFRGVIARQWTRLHEQGVRIRIIGDLSKFPPDIQSGMDKVVRETKNNTKITAIFALNYGGRDEIVRAVGKAVRAKQELSEASVSGRLDTAGIPDPEFIIRTGGEQRLSGFMLWQSEYSELYFPKFYMPDFTPEKFDEALAEFAGRKRRFGK